MGNLSELDWVWTRASGSLLPLMPRPPLSAFTAAELGPATGNSLPHCRPSGLLQHRQRPTPLATSLFSARVLGFDAVGILLVYQLPRYRRLSFPAVAVAICSSLFLSSKGLGIRVWGLRKRWRESREWSGSGSRSREMRPTLMLVLLIFLFPLFYNYHDLNPK